MLTERSAVIALVYAQADAQGAPVNVTPQIGRAVGNALGSASSDPVQSVSLGQIRHFRNEKGSGAEMCAAIHSGIVTRHRAGQLFANFPPVPITVPKVFAKVDSAKFSSRF